MNVDELPLWALELLREARVAHLGLLDEDGFPRVLPVTFALHEGAAWSAVDDKPKRRPGKDLARVRRLRTQPRSSLTVDRYDEDWSKLAWVQLVGTTAVLDAVGNEAAVAALAARYDAYRERPPGGPLLRLEPLRARCWRAREDGDRVAP